MKRVVTLRLRQSALGRRRHAALESGCASHLAEQFLQPTVRHASTHFKGHDAHLAIDLNIYGACFVKGMTLSLLWSHCEAS